MLCEYEDGAMTEGTLVACEKLVVEGSDVVGENSGEE